MKSIVIYTKDYCPYCKRAAAILKQKNVEFQELDVTQDQETFDKAIAKSGCRTVPQLFVDGEYIGGHDDMVALEAQGKLNELLGL